MQEQEIKELFLYDLPNNSPMRIRLDPDRIDICTFHHLDGLYSYCTTSDGTPFHLSRNIPMIKRKFGV